MSQKYPTLTQMGITNPQQIASYNLVTVEPTKDVLRIKYKRPAGSLLPVTRSYEFSRVPRASDPNATFGHEMTIYEIAPILDAALLELDSITRVHRDTDDRVSDVLEQLNHLEQMASAELKSIRAKIEEIRQ